MRFAARNEVIYTVNIYDEGWTGSVTTLTAAANPFETQEDKSDNVFTPVRYSTGYLRFIVTEPSVLNDIMCKSVDGRYVTLTTTSGDLTTIHWQGYMQAQSFETEWEPVPYEIEFPIVSSLGILEEKPYTPANSFLTLGYIMRRALTNSDNIIDFNTWHTPYRTSTHDLLAKINDHCFRNSDAEEWVKYLGYNANTSFPEESVTCLEVISQICQYFGWTAYERGTHIYFVSVNGTTTYEWGYFSEINQGGSMTIRGTETAAVVALPNVRSNDNSRKFLKGYGYFEISEELDAPENPVNFDLTQAQPVSEEVKKADAVDGLYIRYGNISDGNIIATEQNTGDVLGGFPPIAGMNYYGTQLARLKTTNNWFLPLYGSEERSEFDPVVVLKSGPVEKTVIFESARPVCGRVFSGGLALNAEVKWYNYSELKYDNVPDGAVVRAKLQWGNKYLKANVPRWEWTTTETTFAIKITKGKMHGGIIDSYAAIPGLGYLVNEPDDIFFIPGDTSLNGNIILTLYASATGTQSIDNNVTILCNMSMEAFSPNAISAKSNTDLGKNLFRKTSSMGGFDVLSQENALCTGINGCQVSDKMVLANDLVTALATIPAQDTVDRMAAMYGQPTEQIEVDVDGVSFTPYNPITFDNRRYFNASVEIRWRDNKTKLQLQKLPTT